MLACCREKLSQLPRNVQQRVRLVAGDMTAFDLAEKFALIIIPFRPFQHLLAVEDQLACLIAAKRHLAPGGRQVFDSFQTDARRMHAPVFLRERPVPGEVTLDDGRVVRVRERTIVFDRAIQSNDVELICCVTHPGGRIEPFQIPPESATSSATKSSTCWRAPLSASRNSSGISRGPRCATTHPT
jgi:hypothetical protein